MLLIKAHFVVLPRGDGRLGPGCRTYLVVHKGNVRSDVMSTRRPKIEWSTLHLSHMVTYCNVWSHMVTAPALPKSLAPRRT